MFTKELIQKFNQLKTPFFYYDIEVLRAILSKVKKQAEKYNFHVHYAFKANTNDRILKEILSYGLGADCVSGNEVKKALEIGFKGNDIAFAGVGKSDEEINLALDANIFCFNCESVPELEIINELAAAKGKVANVALRLNPNVDAKTHHYISTGLEENKFGINAWDLDDVIAKVKSFEYVKLVGLHFHIGSQITDLEVYKGLCARVNQFQERFYANHIIVDHINVGGGLGIDYRNPDNDKLSDFASYFKNFNDLLDLRPHQTLHFELGRSIVGQCGSLITKVLYVKKGVKTDFSVVDAGMTELIRPALYQAYHKIENLSNKDGATKKYDVVGPICESSDCFGKALELPETKRGDLIAIRSAGAYGQVMSSQYNLRDLAKAYYSDEI